MDLLKLALAYVKSGRRRLMDLHELAIKLSEFSAEGASFETLLLPVDDSVLQVVVEDFEELPIYITATEDQLLCVTHLFNQNEVDPDSECEMNKMMLELNVHMPLSSFALLGDQYVVFGSLSVHSRVEDIAHELVTQADNGLDALEILQEFLA